jgi:putative phosphoribosyl transferase
MAVVLFAPLEVRIGAPRLLSCVKLSQVLSTVIVAVLDDADEVIAVVTPRYFGSVGQFYRDFYPTSDDEVVKLLSLGRQGSGS